MNLTKGIMKKIILSISVLLGVFIATIIATIVVINIPIKNEIVEREIYEALGDRISKKSSYNNPIIPEGFKKVETETASWELENGVPKGWDSGLVIEDENGNQFVWVPDEKHDDLSKYKVIENFTKEPFKNKKFIGSFVKGSFENENEDEFLQAVNYGGFYISRYEAGLPEFIQGNVKEFSAESNNVYGIPISKKDQIVWNFISWDTAKYNACHMYDSKSIKSDLSTRNQWQTISTWISDNMDVNRESSTKNYGNYSNVNFIFTGYYSTDYGKTYRYGENKNKAVENMLLSTGATERNNTNNIYDLAGNVSELLDKKNVIRDDKIYTSYSRIGGYYDNMGGVYPLGSDIQGVDRASSQQGFRIVLYLE